MKWRDIPYNAPDYNEAQDTLVRQSTISQLQLCGGRVGMADQPGHLAMVSEPLAFGTAVHHLIAEDLLHGEQQDRLLLSMHQWVDEMLIEQYEWSLDRVPDPRAFFGEITTAYRLWREDVFPRIDRGKVLSIEEEQYLYLGEGREGNIWLRGTADLVLEGTLVDWKTSGRGWKQAKAEDSIQASLYMPLYKQALGVPIQKFTFWVFNRQRREWTPHATKRRVAEINAALTNALEYGKQLEAKIFPCTPTTEVYFEPKRGWYCSPKFCGAWNICTAKFINDGVNENVVAERSW